MLCSWFKLIVYQSLTDEISLHKWQWLKVVAVQFDCCRAAIVLREENLGQVMSLVNQISDERIFSMRRQVMFLYEMYFSSIRAITLTTLQVLNDRVFPYAAKKYEEWNDPPIKVCSNMPEHFGVSECNCKYYWSNKWMFRTQFNYVLTRQKLNVYIFCKQFCDYHNNYYIIMSCLKECFGHT